MTTNKTNQTRTTTLAASASLVATAVTGATCALPLTAILLGVGGLGWLTQYSSLRVPATLATFVLLGFAFRAQTKGKPASANCTRSAVRRRQRAPRWLLWIATAVAIVVNLFEYVILPELI